MHGEIKPQIAPAVPFPCLRDVSDSCGGGTLPCLCVIVLIGLLFCKHEDALAKVLRFQIWLIALAREFSMCSALPLAMMD